MGEKKLGIDESKEVVKFVSEIIDRLAEAKADDGKIDAGELAASLAATAPDAVKAIWGSWKVGAELKDLDDAEGKELMMQSFPVILKLFELFIPAKG